MAKTLIRCLYNSDYYNLKNGQYNHDMVSVYYGFNNYNRTAKQVLELIDIVKNEVPGIDMSDLNVYEITTAQSDRHAHYTMVQVYMKTNVVCDNLNSYIIL